MVFGLSTALGRHCAPEIDVAHDVRSPETVGASLAASQRGSANADVWQDP